MNRRVLTVGLAVLLAVLGTAGVFVYVNQADVRAIADQQPVTALVADRRLAAGTPAGQALADGLLRAVTLPAGSVPPDAVVTITPDLGALVTNAELVPGQLLLRPTLVTIVQATGTGGLSIPPGMVAVSINLCVPEGVAGHVRRGSRIAIFDTEVAGVEARAQQSCEAKHEEQRGTGATTRVVLTGVEVLAIRESAGEAATPNQAATDPTPAAGAQDTVLLTVALDQGDAERLITLTHTGLPYVALLGEGSEITADPVPVVADPDN